MTEELDQKLGQLKTLDDSIKKLSNEKETLRTEVFDIIAKENMDTYKNEIATVSKVQRKSVKYLVKPEELVEKLPSEYIETVAEEIIPEHKEIKKNFEEAIKNGIEFEGVELQIKENLTIRF